MRMRRWLPLILGVLGACVAPAMGSAQVAGKNDPDIEGLRQELSKYFPRPGSGASTEALPDVFGPGAVLTVGNIFMKITNWGFNGNLFPQLSSDPSAQWPGVSGVEYMSSIRLLVGAVNPLPGTPPDQKRRVSYLQEWRPYDLDPKYKIYRGYDGIINGTRFGNDDGDKYIDPGTGDQVDLIDEDFLDGLDNDGDGRIDEDFGALGQQMFSLVMWDNTIQAINTTFNEKHVPIGLECREKAWAYSIRGFQDFDVMEFEIFNRSGHDLDSVSVGFLVDMDAGPFETSNFFQDDLDLPHFPQGEFDVTVGDVLPDAERVQSPHDPQIAITGGLCTHQKLRINGFSTADDNGDDGRTTGIPAFLLVEHSVDPLGIFGPSHVGFRSFRSYTLGTPYTQGGQPNVDQERFEFMVSNQNIRVPANGAEVNTRIDGFVSPDFRPGESKGDYRQVVTVGSPVGDRELGTRLLTPHTSGGLWHLSNNQSIHVTVAFGIKDQTYAQATRYEADYQRYVNATDPEEQSRLAALLLATYPPLANAFAMQIAYEGIHVLGQPGFPRNTYHGRETGIRRAPGQNDTSYTEICPGREPPERVVTVNNREYSWFDFDCDYCTGPWNYNAGRGSDPKNGGLFHKTWNAEAPPPAPNLNVSTGYNFTDNPSRRYVPSGDRQVTLAWDNLSEITADPKSECFDFRGYRIWKVSDWTRPVGSAGPAERDWKLIGEYRLFDYEMRAPGTQNTWIPILRNYSVDSLTGEKHCPEVYVPNYVWYDSTAGVTREGKIVPICLDQGDLWDKQSGLIIKPDTSLHCIPDERGQNGCGGALGGKIHRGVPNCRRDVNKGWRDHFPVGRYRYVDREVKNGFIYFYSVTALDSATDQSITTELEGRRSAVEPEAVFPQVSTRTGRNVWVVPNPYRGYSQIARRSSSWDLTPNASDPTGTHIDFMGLPAGPWTIRIYTVSGDLVAEIRSSDPVNESLRSPQTIPGTQQSVPGYNRQQDYADDGQARWNLISRNGQDIVSGIYLFTVDSNQGTQRGRFVVIR